MRRATRVLAFEQFLARHYLGVPVAATIGGGLTLAIGIADQIFYPATAVLPIPVVGAVAIWCLAWLVLWRQWRPGGRARAQLSAKLANVPPYHSK